MTQGQRPREVFSRALAALILAQRLEPDFAFDSYRRLADAWRTNVDTVRETMVVLEHAALIGVGNGRGAHVRPTGDWDLLHPLVIAEAHRCSPDAAKIVAYHDEVERGVVYEALLGAGPPPSEALDRIASAQRRLEDAARQPRPDHAYHAADQALHVAIVETCGNPASIRLGRSLRRALTDYALSRVLVPEDIDRDIDEHRRILRALIAADMVLAARLLREHLVAAATRLSTRPSRPVPSPIESLTFPLRHWRP